MTADRWKQIEAIYHLALDRPDGERAVFIAGACHGDQDLRNEVEDLVGRDQSPGPSLLDSSVTETETERDATPASGARLGPYEILDPIGSGGMGFVFRAIDTRLGRSVAIKTSRGRFSERFAREARAIASLNHPNICTLYDTGPDYLVMELIEGPTLADRIRKGPIRLEEALRIAGQIAAGLESAHEKGIVHRDLKPANIKIRADGSVKVLDFGLAQSAGQEPALDSLEMKLSGMVAGTAAYMSPEQALGQKVDKRSDIWAFGVVLYEMLTGSRPFGGDTASDCIAQIVQKEADLTKVPARVRRLLGLCLAKDPNKRLRSLGDQERFIDADESGRTWSGARGIRKAAWAAVPVILIAAAMGIRSKWFRPSNPPHPTRFQIDLPDHIYFDRYVSVSPDGQNLVFNATGEKDGLWIHNLDTLDWRRLPGTEHGKSPFWSPDGRSVGFVVGGSSEDQVKKIDLVGGSAATVYSVAGHHLGQGDWNQSGELLIGSPDGAPIRHISAKGGAVALTAIDRAHGETSHERPQFLPDGKHFLYWIHGSPEAEGTYSGSVDDLPAAQPRERILTVMARYVSGKLLFVSGGNLMARNFDADRRRLTGEPTPIAEHVQTIFPIPVFSASAGVLAYRSGTESPGYVFTWFDRHGKEIGTVGQPGQDIEPRISPDQQRAAVTDAGPHPNIWILDFARGLRTRFTFQPPAMSPVWSPDGKRIYYSSGPKLESIFEKDVSGSTPETELLKQPGKYLFPSSIVNAK